MLWTIFIIAILAPIAVVIGVIILAVLIKYRAFIYVVLIALILWLNYLNDQSQRQYEAEMRCISQLQATGMYRGQAEVDCSTARHPLN